MADTNKTMVPALFLHIQKTAGTSIVKMAASHYGAFNVSSHDDFVGRSPEEFASTSSVSGHFGYTLAKPLMNGRFTFTFLRDPLERTLSFYYFCQRKNQNEYPIYKLAQTLDIDSFLLTLLNDRSMKWMIYNTQVWYLACGPGDTETRINYIQPQELLDMAIMNLAKFTYVGFTETFEDDVGEIKRALHIESTQKRLMENVTSDRGALSDHAKSTISLIEELTQLDRKLYDAAWQSRKLSALSLAV